MVRLAACVVILYLALKSAQWAIRPRANYAEEAPAFLPEIMRSEPWLLLAAILLPTSVFVYSNWWTNRWATRGFAHATDCIGQLVSADRLPNVYAKFRRTDVSASALSYYSLARDLGSRLKLESDQINSIIDRRRDLYAARYSDLVRQRSGQKIEEQFASIERCVNDEWDHDGIFNP